jgi:cell division protein FtsI/penicillin-binding protein 2
MIQQLRVRNRWVTVLSSLTLVALAILSMMRHGAQAAPAAAVIAPALPAPPDWRRQLDWSRVREDGAGFVQVLKDGGHVELTLDPRLQRAAEHVLSATAAKESAAVLLSVDDGRVLALAGRDRGEEGNRAELALKAWAPAASVFKLVTTAALVSSGVEPDARVCYHDGVHSVEASNLSAHPRWDRDCKTLSFGLAKSQNAIIARLAHDHLSPSLLERAAHAFGFGAPLPFELKTAPSEVHVPEAALAFARTAAGFWNTTLSPLHGAFLAATLARGGVTPPLRIVDQVVDRDGVALRPTGAPERRVVAETVARDVARMMVGTTEFGTARLGFHDRRGRPLLPGVAVAGKTGSLDKHDPYTAYSWFVGFAPAERPEVAVAILLANGDAGQKRASHVAAELLADYFHGAPGAKIASR